MKHLRNTFLTLCLLAFLCILPYKVQASDISIHSYSYGDAYITGVYWGDGEDPEFIAYKGTDPLPDKNTKVYKGSYDEDTNEFKIKTPAQWKVGAKFTVRCVSWNEEYESTNIDVEKGKVVKPADLDYYYWYITASQRTVKVRVENVHKGDQIKIKIGKKTYTKKIKKNTKKKTYKVKVGKAKAGTKMTVWVANKYGQALVRKDKTVIYKYKSVKVGMTKKQAKLAIGWRYPDKKNYYTYSEQWCYDDDGDGSMDAYLYFNNKGKVTGWQIFG